MHALKTTGAHVRTLGALNLTGARRERRMLAQVDKAGTGGAAQPRTPIVDHRIRGEQAHDGDLEEHSEGRVAQRRAERRSLRVVLVADQAHTHEGHARRPARRAEHERGGNHGLSGDHSDRPRREVHVPRHAKQDPEDQQVDEIRADEPRSGRMGERSLRSISHYRTALQANSKRPEEMTAAGRSVKMQKVCTKSRIVPARAA